MLSSTVATGSGTNGPYSALMQGRVDCDLMSGLRDHGLCCPIRGIHDPRLEYPEMLITSGWERVDVKDGWGYRIDVDKDDQGDAWSQYYEQHDDGSSMLQTQSGRKVQIVKESSSGAITTTTRTI